MCVPDNSGQTKCRRMGRGQVLYLPCRGDMSFFIANTVDNIFGSPEIVFVVFDKFCNYIKFLKANYCKLLMFCNIIRQKTRHLLPVRFFIVSYYTMGEIIIMCSNTIYYYNIWNDTTNNLRQFIRYFKCCSKPFICSAFLLLFVAN